MKILYFLLLNFLLAQNIYAQNPIASPTFDDILKDIVKNDKYVFDNKNIKMVVCENTMKQRKITKDQLLPFAGTVPMGIGEIIMKSSIMNLLNSVLWLI